MPDGQPTSWNIIPQRFSHRSESSEPHIRLPSQRIWLWRSVGFDCRNSTGLGETETSVLESTHRVSCAPGPRGKNQWPHKRLGQTYLLVLEGLLRRRGAAVAHCGDKDMGGGSSEKYSLVWTLLEATIFSPRPGPSQQSAGSSAGTPQAKQPTGWEHSPTHQQTGCLKSSKHTASQ